MEMELEIGNGDGDGVKVMKGRKVPPGAMVEA